MAEQLLHFAALVGDPGDRAELAAGERRRHGDLSDHWSTARRWTHESVGTLDRTDVVQRLRRANVVGQAKLHHFGTIDDGATADRRNQIGAGLARLFRRSDDRAP